MNRSFLEVEPRNFKAMSVPGLEKEVRDAVNAALKAMSSWRNDIADTTEYNGKRVIEKMAAAAAALGWPEQIVDAARVQMQSIAEMQIQTMDQMMDSWEEQLRLPNPAAASPSAMLSKLKSLPGFAPTGSWPGAEAFQKAAMNPLQFWMQFAEQWQRSWSETMAFWGKAGKLH
jgi:ribonuclease D